MNKSYYCCYLITTRRHWGRSALACCSRLWRRDDFFRVVRTPQGSVVHACLPETETIVRKIKYLFKQVITDQPGCTIHRSTLALLAGSEANVTEKITFFSFRKQSFWVQDTIYRPSRQKIADRLWKGLCHQDDQCRKY